jgi:3-deoxy-D-manno-octulosonate 8-phosphate phosphatase (KDO 8-P phosphatase)
MADIPAYAKPMGPGRIGEVLAEVRLVAFDFDGVFTDNTVYVSEQGVESVRCWRSDGIGLTRLRSIGVHVMIMSTEVNPVVAARARKMQAPCRQGITDKAAEIVACCEELGLEPRHAMFVGNDINDIPAFKLVGAPVAVHDAYPEVLSHVLYRTLRRGGLGAVREVCDLVYHAKTAATPGSVTHGR